MSEWIRKGDRVPNYGETRFDEHGKIRAMAYAEGYVMCRRTGATPLVMSLQKWNDLSTMPLPDPPTATPA